MREIGQDYLDEFQNVWREKLEAIPAKAEGIQGLKSENQRLQMLLPAQPKKSKQSECEIDEEIKSLENEIRMSEPEKRSLIHNITTAMVGNATSFSNDFRFNKLESSASSEVFDQSIKNVSDKTQYLYSQIHRLERVQIAESIMQIETLNGGISRFLIRFDEALLSLEMELGLPELLELNRLREYSLFGIHKTPPNSPVSLFSYCRELNELCSQKDFFFLQHFPYVQTPEVFAKDIAKMHGKLLKSKPSEPLTMCHHCKVLLPSKSFFSCAKKFKRMQTDPCRPLLTQGTS